MCYFPQNMAFLLGSYKNLPDFQELPGQLLDSESSKWICSERTGTKNRHVQKL